VGGSGERAKSVLDKVNIFLCESPSQPEQKSQGQRGFRLILTNFSSQAGSLHGWLRNVKLMELICFDPFWNLLLYSKKWHFSRVKYKLDVADQRSQLL
jgi:hypothetical protein